MSNEIVWEIEYYELSNDKQPFFKRPKRIRNTTACTKIVKSINRMKFDNFGDSRPAGNGVSELRVLPHLQSLALT